MAGLPQDFRFGLRALRSAPGFSIVAIAALALGIGATSAIFTLLYGVMIRPLPFTDPDRIVTSISTREMRGIRDGGVSYADYQDWRQQPNLFQYAALWRPASFDLTGGDRPERVRALAVTGEFFQVLGGLPILGRTFGPEAEADGDRPVVLTDGAWQRLFGGDRGAIGRTIYLSGLPSQLLPSFPPTLPGPKTRTHSCRCVSIRPRIPRSSAGTISSSDRSHGCTHRRVSSKPGRASRRLRMESNSSSRLPALAGIMTSSDCMTTRWAKSFAARC